MKTTFETLPERKGPIDHANQRDNIDYKSPFSYRANRKLSRRIDSSDTNEMTYGSNDRTNRIIRPSSVLQINENIILPGKRAMEPSSDDNSSDPMILGSKRFDWLALAKEAIKDITISSVSMLLRC